jgi:hypothetical protein
MMEGILRLQSNPWIAVCLYWAPLALCAYGYLMRTWFNYRKDVETRKKEPHYYPTDTIGSLIGRAVVTILPVGNLLAAIFDVAPEVFGRFFKWIGRVFNQPLVPKLKEEK